MSSEGDNLSLWDISSLTLEAVLQTMIVCVTGFWAARQGYLDRSAQRSISTMNVMVFTPCLVFSKIASQLTVSALIDIALIPVIFALSTGISYACSRICSRWFGFNKRDTNFVSAMAVFGNSNSVPVSLFLNLAASLPALRWPEIPGDNSENVASRGILYLLIFQQLGQMLRWSWGFNTLLAPADPLPLPAAANATEVNNADTQTDNNNTSAQESRVTISTSPGSVSASKKSLLRLFVDEFRSFMNPPLWAMLAAVVVASITPLKVALYGSDSFLNKTVGRGIQQVGATAVPLILVVLGSNLAPSNSPSDPDLGRSPRYGQLIFAGLLSRMILPALVLLPLFSLAVRYLGISILDDPAFLVATFILTASPPAIQLSQICQLNQVYEAEMAGVLFWGYAVLSLPSAIVIVVISLKVLGWAQLSVQDVVEALPIIANKST